MVTSPVELRVGSTGAGLFVGCGMGVGIVTPVSLHSIPVLGQLVSSLATSLGSLNHATGGIATAARSRVRSLGVRNLDLGFGCGVLLGYGYGAGVMLKPTALQSLTQALQSAGQQLAAKLPPPLQAALQQQQQRHQGMGGGIGMMHSWQDPLLLQQQPGVLTQGGGGGGSPATMLPGADLAAGDATKAAPETAAGHQQGSRRRRRAGTDVADDDVAELTKLVLKQQNQLSDLQQQVETLQAAVCKLDSSAPGCKKR